jgi:hypothetical protein
MGLLGDWLNGVKSFDPLKRLQPGEHVLLAAGTGAGVFEVMNTQMQRLISRWRSVVFLSGCGFAPHMTSLQATCRLVGREKDFAFTVFDNDVPTGASRSLGLVNWDSPLLGDRQEVLRALIDERYPDQFVAAPTLDLSVGMPVYVGMLPSLVKSGPEVRLLAAAMIEQVLEAAKKRKLAEQPPFVLFLTDIAFDTLPGWLDKYLPLFTEYGVSVFLAQDLSDRALPWCHMADGHFRYRLSMKQDFAMGPVGQLREGEAYLEHWGMLGCDLVRLPYDPPNCL